MMFEASKCCMPHGVNIFHLSCIAWLLTQQYYFLSEIAKLRAENQSLQQDLIQCQVRNSFISLWSLSYVHSICSVYRCTVYIIIKSKYHAHTVPVYTGSLWNGCWIPFSSIKYCSIYCDAIKSKKRIDDHPSSRFYFSFSSLQQDILCTVGHLPNIFYS